jgi:hypothetical protein
MLQQLKMIRLLMNNELEKICRVLIVGITSVFAWKDLGKPWKISVGIAGIPSR